MTTTTTTSDRPSYSSNSSNSSSNSSSNNNNYNYNNYNNNTGVLQRWILGSTTIEREFGTARTQQGPGPPHTIVSLWVSKVHLQRPRNDANRSPWLTRPCLSRACLRSAQSTQPLTSASFPSSTCMARQDFSCRLRYAKARELL
ncbi:hypothetical protein K504DRAFT_165084 [Pleomassaria siparia CBS 279.74]|uniref:Uncharacterized protein n=1 Tax=Pleomassaria siparia CBS 279.74 TaxID=1314801 RepID=A0A6G1JTD7_9PLEO|nr:hypothetical protein K504DRAFT_165084 [Pleomassaria siparia CBS 279.74]